MDHFARKKDSLYIASQEGKLHRNFMGYTASKTQLMIGLGASSISDSWYSFSQNEKTVEEYYTSLANDELPVSKGHILSKEDLVIRKHILNLMCQFTTSWNTKHLYLDDISTILEQLKEMELDGLVILQPNAITVTEKGKPFVRNICMAFDLRLKKKHLKHNYFL